MKSKVIVAGASGFVGAATVRRLQQSGYRVLGLSRREPEAKIENVDYLSLDLLDKQACIAALAEHKDASAIVYAAVNETSGSLVAGWKDPSHPARNAQMFENLLEAAGVGLNRLQHVSVIHGAKAYGTHRMANFTLPLKESMPRPKGDDFYFRQEDILWQKAKQLGFSWTVFRPHLIVGGGGGSNLSTILALAVYGLIWREMNLPAPFPGAENPIGINQMTDVSLLARGVEWSLSCPQARDKTFNITNGDIYRWQDMWPVLMQALGVAAAPSQPQSVAQFVQDHRAVWAEIVTKYKLSCPEDPFAYLGESFALADYTLPKADNSILLSTIELQQAGFTDCMDSGESLKGWILYWQQSRILPKTSS